MLDACAQLGVTFVAYSPLGRGFLAGNFSSASDLPEGDHRRSHPRFQEQAAAANARLVQAIGDIARRHDASPAQVAIAWVEDGGAEARVIMGSLWGASAPTTCYAETIYAEIALAAGAAIPIEAEADERAVMLVGGEGELDGQPLALYELNLLQPGKAITLRSKRGGRAMLLGGEAFSSNRYVYWNFVSSSRERIEQAKDDWRAGRFASVPGDEEEFIPLPDRPMTVSYP
jgi:hypothetical protein